MVPRFVLTKRKGGIVETGKFQGPILGQTSKIIIRLGYVRKDRILGHNKRGKSV